MGKWLLVTLVSSLAAIMPLQPTWADRASGHLARRRIEIDADKMVFSGNGGWWLRENLAAMLRSRIRATGLVGVAVSGRQFEAVAYTQDRIHDSGRYSQASRRQIPRGEMIAPTDHFSVTGFADLNYNNGGGNLMLGGRNMNLQRNEIRATVRLVIEPIGIARGLSDPGYEVTGEARKSNLSISGNSGWNFGNLNSSSYNVEQRLLEKAASQAVDRFIRQFAPEPIETSPQPSRKHRPVEPQDDHRVRHRADISARGEVTMHLPDGQKKRLVIDEGCVHQGDFIIFHGARTIKYQVLVVDGQDLAVTGANKGQPEPGDRFEVKCP